MRILHSAPGFLLLLALPAAATVVITNDGFTANNQALPGGVDTSENIPALRSSSPTSPQATKAKKATTGRPVRPNGSFRSHPQKANSYQAFRRLA